MLLSKGLTLTIASAFKRDMTYVLGGAWDVKNPSASEYTAPDSSLLAHVRIAGEPSPSGYVR